MKYKISNSVLSKIIIVPILLVVVCNFQTSVFGQGNLGGQGFGRFRTRTQEQFKTPDANAQFVTRGSIVHNSMERTYALLVPPAVTAKGQKVPLVLVLHGGAGNAQHAMKVSRFNAKAVKEGFIVAYPEGSGRMKDILLTWNAGHCCGSAMRNKVDDVGFISKLIDKLEKEYPVDSKRIYVTGMSNGGMMTHRIGIELSDKIAAIAPIVGTLFGDEKTPVHPVPAIMFNGLLDKSVPYEGGTHGGLFASSWDNVPPLKVEEQAVFWAKANGCKSAPQIIDNAKFKHIIYICPAGKNVEMYVIKDQGHAWPGGLQGTSNSASPSNAINATDVMWEFFKKQSK